MAGAGTRPAAAIVVAAGAGRRMGASGSGLPKQYLPLGGVPVVARAIRAVASASGVTRLIAAVPAGDVERFERDIIHRYSLSSFCRCDAVEGGPDRQSSVVAALDALTGGAVSASRPGAVGDGLVVIHDGVRPLASPQLAEAAMEAAARTGAATCGVLPVDSVKHVCGGAVVHTLDRSTLSLVQTPQAFRLDVIVRAHREAVARGYKATDDCALVEALGLPVEVVPGDRHNIKITTFEDMADAEMMLRQRGEMNGTGIRIGQGFDIHRTAAGRRLVLGGVEIPHPMGLGLLGHSDADVVAHAVADAMLGAAGLGDIGRHFPDTDPRYENADSMELLSQVTTMCQAAGWSVVNCDVTIIAQAPRVSHYAGEMAAKLARAMGTAAECVNIKGKTTETLGAIGRLEAIACSAVVLTARQE